MGEIDRGYRTEFRRYGAGERKLEIVSGKVYSANHPYVTRSLPPPPRSPDLPFPRHGKGGKSTARASAWCFSDPEMKRRRRVASYKSYSVEQKVKSSFRKGFRWIKGKCSELVHGW